MNIELHGFWKASTQSIIEAVWSKILGRIPQEEWSDYCVTVMNSETSDKAGRITPFIRIYSDDKKDFPIGINLLKEVKLPGAGMQTFVECILLDQRVKL